MPWRARSRQHRVAERVASQVVADLDVDRLVDAVLEDARTEQVLERALASPGLERLLVRVLESRLVDDLTERLLESPELQRVIEHVAASPEVLAGGDPPHGDARRGDGRRRPPQHPASRRRRRADRAIVAAAAAGQPVMSETPVPYAGIATRAIGLAIDVAIAQVIVFAGGAVLALVASLVDLNLDSGVCRRFSPPAPGRSSSASTSCSSGRPPARRPACALMGLRVRTYDGSHPSLARSFLRLIGLGLSIIPLFAGFLPVLVDDRRRGLLDMIAGTVVVYAEAGLPVETLKTTGGRDRRHRRPQALSRRPVTRRPRPTPSPARARRAGTPAPRRESSRRTASSPAPSSRCR